MFWLQNIIMNIHLSFFSILIISNLIKNTSEINEQQSSITSLPTQQHLLFGREITEKSSPQIQHHSTNDHLFQQSPEQQQNFNNKHDVTAIKSTQLYQQNDVQKDIEPTQNHQYYPLFSQEVELQPSSKEQSELPQHYQQNNHEQLIYKHSQLHQQHQQEKQQHQEKHQQNHHQHHQRQPQQQHHHQHQHQQQQPQQQNQHHHQHLQQSPPSQSQQQQQQQQQISSQQHHHHVTPILSPSPSASSSKSSGNGHIESRSSYAMLSEAMSKAVSHEMSSTGDGACVIDDLECLENVHDRLGMEAIRSLHQQLDDDDNGNIDLTESDDFLREELKYDYGYEKRHKTFHYNDDTQISVKELWEAWLRSEVHNWTTVQTTDWLAESVQLPQYVDLFQRHKVSGETLPRLAVNNMHYVSNVLGIRDPIHRQKIALKAMDVVLFGPPRETGTRWKDYFLITLLLTAIIGSWYAYQQNKNAKKHLRRMAKDIEGLQRAENALSEMQKQLELARLEQENVATEKLDLERRLKEQPLTSTSSYDFELQELRQEIERLRTELSHAELQLVNQNNWSPPAALQTWLQLTYELESKQTLKKRVNAEKQLQQAREACEKLKRKGSSLVGAFVSTHGKSLDDVDRSIVEARNALGEVTSELQERLNRWKHIEQIVGFNIVNNNGLAYLENVLYNDSASNTGKSLKIQTSSSHDEIFDDDSGSDDVIVNNTGTAGVSNDLLNDTCLITSTSSAGLLTSLRYPTSFTSMFQNTITTTTTTTTLGTVPITTNVSSKIGSSIDDDNDQLVPLPRYRRSPVTSDRSISTNSINGPPKPPPRRAYSQQNISKLQNFSLDEESVDMITTPSSISLNSPTNNNINSTISINRSNNIIESQPPEDSTDSSNFDDEFKKRRRKIHFPFGKKNFKK